MKQLQPCSFLTNHARLLIAVAREPEASVDELAVAAQISERAAYRILADLQRDRYVRKRKIGRHNRYEVSWDVTIRDPVVGQPPVRELLFRFAGIDESTATPSAYNHRHPALAGT